MTMSKPISYDHGARIAERARQNNAWSEPAAVSSKPMCETVDPVMREGSIILPVKDNDGHPTIAAHAILCDELLATFGGFTEETVRGVWMDKGIIYRDESIRYTISAPAGSLSQTYLEIIARNAASDAKQVCVYVRGFDGVVRLVKPL